MEFQWISPELFADQLDWWLSKNNAENKKIDVSNWILCKLEAAYLNQQPVQERVSAELSKVMNAALVCNKFLWNPSTWRNSIFARKKNVIMAQNLQRIKTFWTVELN